MAEVQAVETQKPLVHFVSRCREGAPPPPPAMPWAAPTQARVVTYFLCRLGFVVLQ